MYSTIWVDAVAHGAREVRRVALRTAPAYLAAPVLQAAVLAHVLTRVVLAHAALADVVHGVAAVSAHRRAVVLAVVAAGR